MIEKLAFINPEPLFNRTLNPFKKLHNYICTYEICYYETILMANIMSFQLAV